MSAMAEYTGKKMLVGGNWKSNGTVDSVKELCALLNTLAVPGNVEVSAWFRMEIRAVGTKKPA
jgi:triosephosphate isomerase